MVLLLVGALPTWPNSASWGYYPRGSGAGSLDPADIGSERRMMMQRRCRTSSLVRRGHFRVPN
ncbi:MAG: DUF3309 family protein [Candidatus Sulfotelmatobacter sp.]